MGAPTDDELHVRLQAVIARLMKMRTRRGVLLEQMGQTYLAEPEVAGTPSRFIPTMKLREAKNKGEPAGAAEESARGTGAKGGTGYPGLTRGQPPPQLVGIE